MLVLCARASETSADQGRLAATYSRCLLAQSYLLLAHFLSAVLRPPDGRVISSTWLRRNSAMLHANWAKLGGKIETCLLPELGPLGEVQAIELASQREPRAPGIVMLARVGG